MIHLDANVLIRLGALIADGWQPLRRIAHGESAAASSLAWFEFAIGSAQTETETELGYARDFIEDRILNFTLRDTRLAARLYNATGRKRNLKTDACIAACAINADAELLTLNARDFRTFVPHGLRLTGAAS